MENYEELLDEAYKKIKHSDISKSRFEVPDVVSHIQGKKTIITNLEEINF